jgi:hypothetical protein
MRSNNPRILHLYKVVGAFKIAFTRFIWTIYRVCVCPKYCNIATIHNALAIRSSAMIFDYCNYASISVYYVLSGRSLCKYAGNQILKPLKKQNLKEKLA